MKKVLTYITLVLMFVLQTTLCKNIQILHIMPNIMLVFIVCYSMYSEPVPATILGVVCGVLIDVFQAQNMGFSTITLMYLSLGLSCMTSGYIRSNILTVLVFTAISTIIYESVYTTLTFFLYGKITFFQLFVKILVETIYNVVIAIPLGFLSKYLAEDEVRSF